MINVMNMINNGTLSIKSDDDAIKAISIHLLTQMDQSMAGTGDCAYRGTSEEIWDDDGYDVIEPGKPTGLACAIGCLIPDSLYHEGLEGTTIDDELITEVIKQAHPDWDITEKTIKLLKGFQLIHDRSKSTDLWGIYIDRLEYLYRSNQLQKIEITKILDALKVEVYTELENIIVQTPQVDKFADIVRTRILNLYMSKDGENVE